MNLVLTLAISCLSKWLSKWILPWQQQLVKVTFWREVWQNQSFRSQSSLSKYVVKVRRNSLLSAIFYWRTNTVSAIIYMFNFTPVALVALNRTTVTHPPKPSTTLSLIAIPIIAASSVPGSITPFLSISGTLPLTLGGSLVSARHACPQRPHRQPLPPNTVTFKSRPFPPSFSLL